MITVEDGNTRGIAFIDDGVFFTPTAGKVENVKLTSQTSTKIGDVVNLRLDFTPMHAISGATSSIVMELPSQIDFSCTI